MPEQLQSFKVGDKLGRQPGIVAKQPAATEKRAEQPSTGFPRVEALIDEYKTADEAKEVFADTIARIEGLLAAEKNPKKKAELVKAKRAFEHTMNTLDYLFQVKNELAQAQISASSVKKK